MSTTVYGASDDLIEIEGDISDEFTAPGEYGDESRDGGFLAFSDGTVLEIQYTDSGVWRIHPIHHGASAVTIEQAPADDESNYSDRATLDHTITWVVLGTARAANKRST